MYNCTCAHGSLIFCGCLVKEKNKYKVPLPSLKRLFRISVPAFLLIHWSIFSISCDRLSEQFSGSQGLSEQLISRSHMSHAAIGKPEQDTVVGLDRVVRHRLATTLNWTGSIVKTTIQTENFQAYRAYTLLWNLYGKVLVSGPYSNGWVDATLL